MVIPARGVGITLRLRDRGSASPPVRAVHARDEGTVEPGYFLRGRRTRFVRNPARLPSVSIVSPGDRSAELSAARLGIPRTSSARVLQWSVRRQLCTFACLLHIPRELAAHRYPASCSAKKSCHGSAATLRLQQGCARSKSPRWQRRFVTESSGQVAAPCPKSGTAHAGRSGAPAPSAFVESILVLHEACSSLRRRRQVDKSGVAGDPGGPELGPH